VHPGQVLEDLFLHGEKRRLVKAEITRSAAGDPPRHPPEHCDHRGAHGIRQKTQVREPGVESWADHARQSGPLQVGMVEEQPPVVAVDSLDRPPVLLHTTTGAPAPAIDTRAVKRPVQPGLLQFVRLHAHDATANAADAG
jgi:hypothetical protein